MVERLTAADTVLFLDLPRRVCLWRVVKRRVLHRGQSRPDVAPGCPEQLDRAFLKYLWRWGRDNRPELMAQIEALHGEQAVVRLTSPREVAAFLGRISRSSLHERHAKGKDNGH
jgi:adenylate kinase family enzyme